MNKRKHIGFILSALFQCLKNEIKNHHQRARCIRRRADVGLYCRKFI